MGSMGIYGYLWSRRLNAISLAISTISNLIEIPIDRKIWKTMAVFNKNDGTLYLATSRDNFFVIQKEIQQGRRSHYMYALTSQNCKKSQQLTLDGLEDPNSSEEYRLEEAKKILGENFTNVKVTYIITYDYFIDAAVNGNIFLVDSNFNLIDTVEIPEYKDPTPTNDVKISTDTEIGYQESHSNQIVKWKTDKEKRPIQNRKIINDTSN